MLEKKHIAVVKNFFEDFSNSIEKVLSDNFDEDVCGNIKFSIDSLEDVSDISSLKENNALCEFAYTVEDCTGSSLLLIPEEFIAASSDIIMGGEGKDAYKGTLSELEMNATIGLINSIFEKIKMSFKTLHEKDVVLPSEVQIVTRESDDFDVKAANSALDFVISYNLSLTEEMSFKLFFLTSGDALKSTLINIGLLDKEKTQNISAVMPKESDRFSDIGNLSDIKIKLDAELGRCKIPIKRILGFAKGSILELDAFENEDLRIFANGLEVARAKPVVIDDYLGIQITKILDPKQRMNGI